MLFGFMGAVGLGADFMSNPAGAKAWGKIALCVVAVNEMPTPG